jgi:phosphatidylinositol alpha-mannosyltransferase
MPYSPLLAGKVINAALPATAVVGTFHILPHGRASSLGTSALSALVKKSKKRFDGIISVSSAASSFAQSHFGITSTILPNIVDLSRYNKGAALKIYSDKENIIFLGRFVERKGAHYLLSAYGQLITDHPELALVTRLILCGDGPDRSKLEESAADIRKAGGDIVFTGFLQEDEKKNYLASATLAVFPSTGGESFGIVLIEAMAAGAGAVLGGDNPGYLTVIGDNPLAVVQPKKTVAFSKSLHTLLTDSEKRTTLHASQQTAVKEYDVAVVGPKIEQFYRDALASRTITKHT